MVTSKVWKGPLSNFHKWCISFCQSPHHAHTVTEKTKSSLIFRWRWSTLKWCLLGSSWQSVHWGWAGNPIPSHPSPPLPEFWASMEVHPPLLSQLHSQHLFLGSKAPGPAAWPGGIPAPAGLTLFVFVLYGSILLNRYTDKINLRWLKIKIVVTFANIHSKAGAQRGLRGAGLSWSGWCLRGCDHFVKIHLAT